MKRFLVRPGAVSAEAREDRKGKQGEAEKAKRSCGETAAHLLSSFDGVSHRDRA